MIAGKTHSQWTDYDIDSDLLTPADDFQVTLGRPVDAKPDAVQPGDTVEVRVGEDTVLSGRIDRVSTTTAIRSFGGYIDLDCLVSWLLFSGNTAADLDELCRKTMYNCISLSDYPEAQDYLQGVEIVSQSYRELIPQHIGNARTLLVLDPPYVCTQQGNYRKAAYFGMVEFLRLMAMVRPPFVFFSSTRSELPAYLDLVAELRLPGWERFAGSQTLTVSSTINRNSSYDDHLIYKF